MSAGPYHDRANETTGRGARWTWSRLWQAPTFCLGLISLLLVAADLLTQRGPNDEFYHDLRQLRRAVRSPSELASQHLDIDKFLERAIEHPRHLSEVHYLVGSYYFVRGEGPPRRPETRDDEATVKAIDHLNQALALGPAEGDLGPLFFRLGMAHVRRGDNLPQALAWIQQGLDLGAENPARGYAFLVEAYLNLTPPNLSAALHANQKHLSHVNERDPEAIGKARYLHADILHRLERRQEAITELGLIDPEVSPPLLAQARLLQARCYEDEGLWLLARKCWSELLPLSNEVPGKRGRVLFSLGAACLRLEPPDFATATPLWEEAAQGSGDEAQAAALLLGHAYLRGPRYDPDAALTSWKAALGEVRVSSDYRNRYLDLPRVLDLFQQACQLFIDRRDFTRSQTLAGLFSRVAPPGAAEERIGETYLRWGKDLVDQAEREPDRREKLLSEARKRFQVAGVSFDQATHSRETTAKIDLYWNSATSFLAARDFGKAAMVLEKFIAVTQKDARLAQGHFSLAETYVAQNQKNKAREHFLKCIELDTPPYVTKALWQLAQEELDAKNLSRAREILSQVVGKAGPDMDREIQEKSLYQLGNLLYDLKEVDEAAIRLREATRRFPNHPGVWKARERLGDYYWEKARQLAPDEPSPERRPLAQVLRQKQRGFLSDALEVFQSLDRDLEQRYKTRKLPMEDLLLWRKALFAVGDLRIELEEYTEAIQYFRVLQHRYKDQVESLFAARKIYFCWKAVTQGADERHLLHPIALESIQSAYRDLDTIPRDRDAELFGGGPNVYSRDQWMQFLRRWEGELQHVTLRVNTNNFAPQP